MNTSVTSEYLSTLPSSFHGGRGGVGASPHTSNNDLNTENTFRWPHAIAGERTSPVAITTNGYNFFADRTLSSGGVPTTSTDVSANRFPNPYKCTSYDSALPHLPPPPPMNHQQDYQQTRYDPYENQFRNDANFFRKPDSTSQEQQNNPSITLSQDTRSYPTPPNPTVTSLPQPPLPSASLNQPHSSAFQNPMSSTSFPTPLRMDFHDDANRPRSHNLPNYVDNNFIPSSHHHHHMMSESSRTALSTGVMGGEVMQNPKQEESPEDSTKNEVQKIMQSIKSEDKKPTGKSPPQDIKNVPTPKDNSTKTESNNSQSSQQENGLPSYTAMIAQAILKKENSKSTLSDIYEYMEKHFPSLEKRGTGWRNCVRHTLSLNDCFIKLHRPENGRSCNWAIHPTYYESFSKGDYRKRRALRKRPRGLQWIDPVMLAGYQFAREHDVYPDIHQQPSPFYHYPPHQATAPPGGNMHPGSPQGYYHSSSGSNFNQNFSAPPSAHLQQPHAGIQHYSPHQNYTAPPQPAASGHHHMSNAPHCTNPECYCQLSKQTRTYTP